MTLADRVLRADLIEMASEASDNEAAVVAALMGAAVAVAAAWVGPSTAIATVRTTLDDLTRPR